MFPIFLSLGCLILFVSVNLALLSKLALLRSWPKSSSTLPPENGDNVLSSLLEVDGTTERSSSVNSDTEASGVGPTSGSQEPPESALQQPSEQEQLQMLLRRKRMQERIEEEEKQGDSAGILLAAALQSWREAVRAYVMGEEEGNGEPQV